MTTEEVAAGEIVEERVMATITVFTYTETNTVRKAGDVWTVTKTVTNTLVSDVPVCRHTWTGKDAGAKAMSHALGAAGWGWLEYVAEAKLDPYYGFKYETWDAEEQKWKYVGERP